MKNPGGLLLEPQRDKEQIHEALCRGQRLVACLCAAWCSSCTAWHQVFSELAAEFPEDCFVWIDIEDHSDLVADIEVETLPVLLVQSMTGIGFLGPIEPRASFLRALLQRRQTNRGSGSEPDLRAALLA